MDYNSSLPIRTENPGDAIVKVADATIPSRQLTVNVDGSVNITDNGGSLTVDAINLDIRDLSALQDNVAISDGTDTLAINVDGSINSVVTANNLDIRDLVFATDKVDVTGSAVTVSNTVTVQSTDLDIRDLSHTQDSVKVGDGTDFLAVNADGSLNITDNGGSLTVDANNLDIRDLVFATDKVDVSGSSVSVTNFPSTVDTNYGAVGASTIRNASQIGNASGAASFNNGSTGAQTLRVAANLAVAGADVSASNPVPVTISIDNAGVEINNYNTVASVAGNATSNHDYTVTAGKTLLLAQIEASASGKMKIEVQVESGVATNSFSTRFVQFNSTANPNMHIELKSPVSIAAGVRVRIIRTNKDNQSQDVYSTISGQEV